MKRGLNKENSLPDPEFGGESSESARAIHYVVQKDTLMTYVSALEAQADPGIVSGSTIERKKMSTKTIYKRIALVAVAALGAGVLSVAPASATYSSRLTAPAADGYAASSGTTAAVATQVSGANNFVTVTTTNHAGVLTITGSTLSTTNTAASVAVGGLSSTQTQAIVNYTVPTKTAGTITINFFGTSAAGVTDTTATDQLVITVIDAAQLLASPTNSTSFIGAGATPVAVDAAVTASNLNGAAQAANIAVTVKNGVGTGANLTTSAISATIDGPGLLGIGGAAAVASGRFVSQAAGSATAAISVRPDNTGVGGVSTIKIYSGTVLIATETVKFHGAVKTLVATPVNGSISDAATGDAQYAAVITAVDANGVSFKPVDTDLTVVAADVAAQSVTGVTFAAAGGADRVVSGVSLKTTDILMSVDTTATKTGNKSITITHTDTVTAVKTTLAVPFTVGLPRATTAVLSTDKATYLPGEKITLTLTLKDAGGFAVADEATGTDVLATGGITANVSLVGETTTATAVPTVGGKKTWTLYAPLSAGPIVFAGKTGTSLTLAPATAVTLAATATVSDSASMQSLTTLINSLIAKINALSKLVTKIQKKVRA
jgi:trimeric autotransporter adhesin